MHVQTSFTLLVHKIKLVNRQD